MIATVTLYYDTGLAPGNALDGIGTLNDIAVVLHARSFPDVAIKQDILIGDVRLAATFNDVKDADYCKINDMAYYITGIQMINDNVAKLILEPDFVTTVGTYNVDVVSGWCKRRHYRQNEDKLFANLLDEPFVPTNEPEIERGTQMSGGDTGSGVKVVVSSIDLTQMSTIAKKYVDNTGNDLCLVPQLPPPVPSETEYHSRFVDTTGVPYTSSKIALTAAFNPNAQNIRDGLEGMRSLGIESTISAAYILPKEWAEATENNGVYSVITDKSRVMTSSITPEYTAGQQIINKKTFSGQFNKIKVFSMSSGEQNEFRIEDIASYDANDNPVDIQWKLSADTRYNGCPFCKPRYYRKALNTDMMCAISGAHWQQTPLMYNNSSGLGLYGLKSGIADQERDTRLASGLLDKAGDTVINFATGKLLSRMIPNMSESTGFAFANPNARYAAGTKASGDLLTNNGISMTIHNVVFEKRKATADLNERRVSGRGELYFPQNPNTADYIGNKFFDIRTRLSDNDTVRFDNFLSAYGYAVDEEFRPRHFYGRSSHNYVQVENAVLKKINVPQMLLNGFAKALEEGVRIWHVRPNFNGLYSNGFDNNPPIN